VLICWFHFIIRISVFFVGGFSADKNSAANSAIGGGRLSAGFGVSTIFSCDISNDTTCKYGHVEVPVQLILSAAWSRIRESNCFWNVAYPSPRLATLSSKRSRHSPYTDFQTSQTSDKRFFLLFVTLHCRRCRQSCWLYVLNNFKQKSWAAADVLSFITSY